MSIHNEGKSCFDRLERLFSRTLHQGGARRGQRGGRRGARRNVFQAFQAGRVQYRCSPPTPAVLKLSFQYGAILLLSLSLTVSFSHLSIGLP